MRGLWVAPSAVVLASLLACGGASPSGWDFEFETPECSDDPGPDAGVLPVECAQTPDVITKLLSVLPWSDGWLVAGLNATRLGTTRVSAQGAILDSAEYTLGDFVRTAELWEGGMLTVVGPHIVVTYGRNVVAVTPETDPPVRNLTGAAPVNAGAVALDATRVALAGRLSVDDPSRLGYLVLDVETGSELQSHEYPDEVTRPPPTVSRGEWINFSSFVDPTAALVHLEGNRLLLAWVGADRRSIRARLIDEDGTPITSAVLLTSATTDLSLPHFARVAPGRLGMVWTGDSGLEVRYRTLSDDLSDASSDGTVVNAVRRCSQEWARIAPRDSGDGALVIWSTETPQPLGGRVVGPEPEPTLVPASTNADLAPTCSKGVSGAAALATTAAGTLIAFNDPSWRTVHGYGPLVQLIHADAFQ